MRSATNKTGREKECPVEYGENKARTDWQNSNRMSGKRPKPDLVSDETQGMPKRWKPRKARSRVVRRGKDGGGEVRAADLPEKGK